jgi:predicted NAD/FAD-binding protein
MSAARKPRLAVVGGGLAGLTAGYLLRDACEVTLFEKSTRLGGNAYTHVTRDGLEVDIAVAAFSRSGYRSFFRLLSHLDVRTRAAGGSYANFHDLDRKTGLYVSPSTMGLAVARDLWRLYRGVRTAIGILDEEGFAGLTMAQALERVPVLSGQVRICLLCILCLVSSMSAAEILEAPATFFFRKLKVYDDIISPRALYSLRTMENRTRSYVDKLAAPLRDGLVLGADIQSIERTSEHVALRLGNGETRLFDQLVLACNADQALALLAVPSDEERRLLGAWRYKDGRIVLHRDHSSFPPVRLQAYNFLYTTREGVLVTSVNGGLCHEPGLPRECDLISSQHPNFPIDPARIELDTVLRTPIFDRRSVPTIAELPGLNGRQRTFYCGSHFGFGLHEDAVRSAMDVARHFGVGLA